MQNIRSIKYEGPFNSFSTSSSQSDSENDISKKILLDKRKDHNYAVASKGAFQKRGLRSKID